MKTPTEVKDFSSKMLGNNLITHQTGPKGLPVKSVLVHEGVDIDEQIYIAFLHDRVSQGPAIVCSAKGGMDIEKVAEEEPEAVKVFPIDFLEGIQESDCDSVLDFLQLEGNLREEGRQQLKKLYEMFIKLDATQVEINPWAVTPEKELYCVDAKINLDENSLFRHKDIVEMKKQTAASEEVDANEAKAVEAGLNYIALDGSIGCMVNGAGLAMSTMDIIQLKGGSPANFLDVGGSANTK